MRTLLSLPLLVLLSSTAATQATRGPVKLIGWGSANAFGEVQSQVLPCGPTRADCRGILPLAPRPFAGGSAFDPGTSTLYITDGVVVGAIDVPSCGFVCRFVPVLPTPGSLATGLEVDPVHRELWQVSSDWTLITYNIKECPPTVAGRCQVQPLSNRHIPGGIAYDVVGERIFVAGSDFTSTTPNNTIFVMKRSAPCTVACSFSLPNCGANALGPITGLAFDPCTSTLYATDGKQIAAGRMGAGCEYRALACCPNTGNAAYQGLTLEPSHPRHAGKSCTQPSCPACNAMVAGTRGDAVIGNSAFALTIESAPSSSFGILALNIGPCEVPGIPMGCGEVHVPLRPPPIFLTTVIPGTTSPCGGRAAIEIPIPVDVNLCDSPWCAQWVVICRNTLGLGHALSNAVGFEVSF